jgi:hypothetical protein
MTAAKLPFAQKSEEFNFKGLLINETLVHDLNGGEFPCSQRNVALIGNTGICLHEPGDLRLFCRNPARPAIASS